MAGIALALVGIVVLIVAVAALHDPKNPGTAQAASSTSPSPRSSSSTTPPASRTQSSGTSGSPTSSPTSSTHLTAAQLKRKFPLVVLNSTATSGLAAQAAQRFEQGGWTVSSTGNLVNNILSTCAYYDPSVRHAKEAATALRAQYPTIQRVEPKFSGLNPGPVVVVLTSDYSND